MIQTFNGTTKYKCLEHFIECVLQTDFLIKGKLMPEDYTTFYQYSSSWIFSVHKDLDYCIECRLKDECKKIPNHLHKFLEKIGEIDNLRDEGSSDDVYHQLKVAYEVGQSIGQLAFLWRNSNNHPNTPLCEFIIKTQKK